MYKTYLYGGVGNQLFQYFLLYGRNEKFEISELFLMNYKTHNSNLKQLLRINEVSVSPPKAPIANFVFRNIQILLIKAFCALNLARFICIKTDGSINLFEPKKANFFGYWHDLSLFEPYRQEIIYADWNHSIQFLDSYNRKDILSDNTFVLHIRKGDYLVGKNKKIFANLDTQFYIDGFTSLPDSIDKLIICTDDKNWVEYHLIEKLSLFCNNIVLSSHYGCTNWVDDFLLMRFSRNLIISNSTFSWWAAFLNDNNVYYPRRWYINKSFDMKRGSWKYFGAS